MSNRAFIEGVNIIAKYVKGDSFDYAAQHDQIWFGDYDSIIGEDREKLLVLDWFEDEDGWSFFA